MAKMFEKAVEAALGMTSDHPVTTDIDKIVPQVPFIPDEQPVHPNVEAMISGFENTFGKTTDLLIKTAEAFEAKAKELRERAAHIQREHDELPKDIRNAIRYEQESFNELKRFTSLIK